MAAWRWTLRPTTGICARVDSLAREPCDPCDQEIYLGNGAAEADDRERWHQMRGGTLCLAMSAEPDAAEHVCRLARALWRRGGTFVIEVTAQPKNHEPWKQLRAQVLGSLRKRRIVTNAGDSVRYKAASEKGNQAFFDAAPEECPGYDKRRPRATPST